MLNVRFIPYVLKQVIRQRTRTLLTVGAVATAMFLFCAVQAMQQGVEAATRKTAADTTLIVYRENRFCPATSRLPEHYQERIGKMDGVKAVVPMMIVVNNCRTSLDVVTFRGVPEETFVKEVAPGLKVIAGSLEQWRSRSDAALLGEVLADRRGLKVGDRFNAAGVTTYVAGIISSVEPQDQNVGYVHLPFLQQSTGDKKLGLVTQFVVKVTDADKLGDVARRIDAEFEKDQIPTQTSSEKDFVARAAGDVVEMVGFSRWLGYGCLAAVLALVANAIVLSVQDRIREHAVLQTLGYTGSLIARLIVAEGALLALVGGAIGTAAAVAVLSAGDFALSNEGLSILMTAGPRLIATGLALSVVLGVVAGLVPAWQASRREITACFRAV